MPTGASFADILAVVAAELTELGKRPVSAATHTEIVRLRERLDTIVNEFVMCEGCGEMFPFVVQISLNGRTANLCKACAITAVQRESLELPSGRSSVRPKTHSRPASAARRGAKKQQPKASADADEGDGESETAPTVLREESARPAVTAFAVDDVDALGGRATGIREIVRPAPARPVRPAPRPIVEESAVAVATEPGEEPEGAGDDLSSAFTEDMGGDDPFGAEDSFHFLSRRTAKRPASEEPLFKASVADVAKHLRRPTREVRQISKLIEEISPPMDVAKTTRYVLAELRNIRSKIPVDTVPPVVATLKDGIPGEKPNGNGR